MIPEIQTRFHPEYVAKCKVLSGEEVTADKNKANLENELIHLKNVMWFLSNLNLKPRKVVSSIHQVC